STTPRYFASSTKEFRVPGCRPFAHSEKSRSSRPSATYANCRAWEQIPHFPENQRRARLYFLGRRDARTVTPSSAPEDSSGLIYRHTPPQSRRARLTKT